MDRDFNEILAKRLKQAREGLDLTLQKVANQMGFNSYQILSSLEDGTRQIKAPELAKLAKIYLKDISYFLNSKEETEREPVILWRSRFKSDIMKIKEQEFLKYCYNYHDLEDRLGLDHRSKLPQLNDLILNNLSFDSIKELAMRYYNMMQLGSRPACVLEKILEEKYNIKILYLDLGDSGSAASANGKFGAAILVNSAETPWRINYNLAHELFHLITGSSLQHGEIHAESEEKPITEQWADAFASNILLPQDQVTSECENKIKDGRISILDLVGIAREFEVSTEALLWRLVNLRCLHQKNVELIIKTGKIREIDRIQRSDDERKAPQISTRYINLAFKAYQKGLISKGKLAEYLNTERSEIKAVLQHYGYADEEIYDEELAIA